MVAATTGDGTTRALVRALPAWLRRRSGIVGLVVTIAGSDDDLELLLVVSVVCGRRRIDAGAPKRTLVVRDR